MFLVYLLASERAQSVAVIMPKRKSGSGGGADSHSKAAKSEKSELLCLTSAELSTQRVKSFQKWLQLVPLHLVGLR